MDTILKTYGLSKQYKGKFAVREASMTVNAGDIYGFVGENGSGKTTIIRLITGLIHPDGGSFELFGAMNTNPAIRSARRKIGAIVEAPSIYRNMSAAENLRMQCTLLGIEATDERISSVLGAVGLGALAEESKHAGDFSLGMRQRLGIAMALLGEPRFILLDEPMNGLDPAGIVEIRELILKLNREMGITFLISSHILTELALVATKYGIISKGHIIKEITSEQLHELCGKYTLLRAEDNGALISMLGGLYSKECVSLDGDSVRISGEVELNELFRAANEAGVRILSVNTTETSFEQYYLSLVGGMRND